VCRIGSQSFVVLIYDIASVNDKIKRPEYFVTNWHITEKWLVKLVVMQCRQGFTKSLVKAVLLNFFL
jgi:hypothetical protein